MKVEVEDISAIEKKVKVEIPAEQVKDEFELAFNEVQKQAKIKGFRPGKAPRKMIELHFSDYIREKVLKKLLEETLGPALDRKQLKPVIQPSVELGELKQDAAFTYTLDVELKPQVDLKQYKSLELEQDVYEVTEKNIDHAVEDMRERNAIFTEPKEQRPAKNGDLLVVDLKAEINREPVPNAGGDNIQYALGQEVYIPGFAKELAGVGVGEKRTFKVKYPADAPRKELADKEVQYTVEVKSLKEKILPELNDEFAKEFGGHENLADLRKKVGEDLKAYLKRASRIKLERSLIDKLVELNLLEIPKGLVKRHAEELARTALIRMGVKDPSSDDIVKLSEQFTARAEKEVKGGFILEAVVEKEGIKLEPADEDARLKEMAETYQIDPGKLKDQFGADALKRLQAQWLEDKALDFLLSQSKIKEKRVSAEESHSHLEAEEDKE